MKRTAQIVSKPTAGLTLLEIMIAAGIMATAFVLILGSLTSISDTGNSSEARAQANVHLASVLEEIQNISYDELLAYVPPDRPGIGSAQQLEVVCLDSGGSEVTLPSTPDALGGPLPNPLEVQVRFSWIDSKGRPASTRLSTLVGR